MLILHKFKDVSERGKQKVIDFLKKGGMFSALPDADTVEIRMDDRVSNEALVNLGFMLGSLETMDCFLK